MKSNKRIFKVSLFAKAVVQRAAKVLNRNRGDKHNFYEYKISSSKKLKGEILLAYVSEVGFREKDSRWMAGHANRWQTLEMINVWRQFGYNVDLIDHKNTDFVPNKEYDVLIGHEPAFPHLAEKLPNTVKIYYSTTHTWMHRNFQIKKALQDLKKRRAIRLRMPPLDLEHDSWSCANFVFYFGNDNLKHYLALNTRSTPDKMFHVRNGIKFIPSYVESDFKESQKNFLYLGSWGSSFRGLDLLIEIFKSRPELNLFICSDLVYQTEFFWKFGKDLLSSSNIHVLGFVDTNSAYFNQIVSKVTWQIYPTRSEASASSVCLGATRGLIPIISKECTFEGEHLALLMESIDIPGINNTIDVALRKSPDWCRDRSLEIYNWANENLTLDAYRESIKEAIKSVTVNI